MRWLLSRLSSRLGDCQTAKTSRENKPNWLSGLYGRDNSPISPRHPARQQTPDHPITAVHAGGPLATRDALIVIGLTRGVLTFVRPRRREMIMYLQSEQADVAGKMKKIKKCKRQVPLRPVSRRWY